MHKIQHKRGYQLRDWPEIIKEWQKSGLKGMEFCRQKNISPNLFYKNRKELPGSQIRSKSFVEIPANNLFLSQPIEIILPENIRIRLGNNFDPANLKLLIRTVRES